MEKVKKYSILNPKNPIYILILNPKISISVRAIEAVTIHEKDRGWCQKGQVKRTSCFRTSTIGPREITIDDLGILEGVSRRR